MRILFLALTAPFPPTNGHRLRTWSMLQGLAADGHDLTLLVLDDNGAAETESGPLRELCRDVETVPVWRSAGPRQYLSRAQALFTTVPFGAWRLRSPQLQRRLAAKLAAGGFDALICDGVYNMINVPAAAPLPVILNKDDVAHVILDRYVALERHPLRGAYGRVEAWKVRRWERRACSRARLTLASSRVDKELLERVCPGAAIHVVPNTVDTDVYRASSAGAAIERSNPAELIVLYQGGLDWYPNLDAVQFFIQRIWPEVRRLVPTARFRAAGRGPTSPLTRSALQAPAVEFTGTVPDMRTEIQAAHLCVVPLRIGSGTRLKILEAAAMEKPIVSTRIGAEGLDFVAGRDIVIEDQPLAFAHAVAALLQDGARRAALGRAARARVLAQNSQPLMHAAMRQAMQGISA